ncbi:type II toxin-antitoxin system VapC family toxin [Aquincola sp. MAHUQ-54]|uniref:Type II toxin-antitoxin system VapC family toxin n=1 Tax=Aquincola agrisoli TaxID=3119538 RepID=A0AAW9QE83_9BURK
MIVVDTSYSLAAVMPDETRPASLEYALQARLLVPAIWPLEVANALRNSLRRGRLDAQQLPALCETLEALEVEVEQPSPSPLRGVLEAAQRHGLTPYDASYLELALQRRASLATLDTQLAAAARRANIPVLD